LDLFPALLIQVNTAMLDALDSADLKALQSNSQYEVREQYSNKTQIDWQLRNVFII
jgi:hypothetical protein